LKSLSYAKQTESSLHSGCPCLLFVYFWGGWGYEPRRWALYSIFCQSPISVSRNVCFCLSGIFYSLAVTFLLVSSFLLLFRRCTEGKAFKGIINLFIFSMYPTLFCLKKDLDLINKSNRTVNKFDVQAANLVLYIFKMKLFYKIF